MSNLISFNLPTEVRKGLLPCKDASLILKAALYNAGSTFSNFDGLWTGHRAKASLAHVGPLALMLPISLC